MICTHQRFTSSVFAISWAWFARGHRYGVAVVLALWLSWFAVPAFAQAFAALDQPSTATSGKAPTLEERTTALNTRLDQVRGRINAMSGDGIAAPSGATTAEWEEFKRLLNLLANAYESHLDALHKLSNIQQTRQDFQQKSAIWVGFSEQPPYSIDFVDDQWQQVRLKDRELESARLEQAMIESLLESQRLAFQTSAQNLRQATEALEGATPEQIEHVRWLQELNALRKQHNEARIGALDTDIKARKERLAYLSDEKALLQRKALVASRSSPLSQADLDKKLAKLAQQQQGLELETQQAVQFEILAQQKLQRTRERLREVQLKFGEQPLSKLSYPDDTEMLQQVLDADSAEVDVAASNLKVLRLYATALLGRRHVLELRYRIDHAENRKALKEAEAEVQQGLQKLALWQEYLLSDLETTRVRLDTVEHRLANWQSSYGDKAQEQRKHAAYFEQEALLRRVIAEADDLGSRVHNLQETLQWQRDEASIVDKIEAFYVDLIEMANALNDFELLTIDDTITVEGREIVGKRSVTVGKIVTLLIIFALGLWLINRITAYGYGVVKNWQAARASQGLLAIRLFSLLAVVGIVVFALVSVHIPLTVFTFFGGALAIGVGFGAQNILNNFISGLILLTEHSIKLGDIVEVDGVLSRVTKIGSRCCQVHRFDGIDMLIPNSSFLEKNVTNWTLSDQRLRCTVSVGASYDSPVRTAMELVKRAAAEHVQVMQDPPPEVYLDEFGDNALNLRLDFWVDLLVQSNRMRVMSDVRLRIEALFAENGIAMAYPQRDVHLDIAQPVKVALTTAISQVGQAN